MKQIILRIAVPTPLRKTFDYLPPKNCDPAKLVSGIRLLIPFGRQKNSIGFLVSIGNTTEVPATKLKRAITILDQEPLLNQKQIDLLKWASRYYQYPIGDVIFSSLPNLLRQGKPCNYPSKKYYSLNDIADHEASIKNAAKQKALLAKFQTAKNEVSIDELKQWDEFSTHALKGLLEKNLLSETSKFSNPEKIAIPNQLDIPKATKDQKNAIDSITNAKNNFNSFLLNGITGSGKTHVYMEVTNQIIQSGKQVLILLPEIGLTPQLIQRFEQTFNINIAIYHSGLSEQQRLLTWMQARDNSVSIFIGTRSAVWLPLKDPGLIIVDEEHDMSFKQQEGFRYSARDLAVYRAQKANVPIILGSATPSMESIYNVKKSQYKELKLKQRIGNASLPRISTIDLKDSVLNGAFSQILLQQIKTTLELNQQVLLFINQRGFAPAMLCHHCGHVAHCERCDKAMTYHKKREIIWCHHCDKQLPKTTLCPVCNQQEWIEVGHGTERIEQDIAEIFPNANCLRIDRDTTRKKGSMDEHLKKIHNSEAEILIGTQMLAKGHDFPNLTLVGIVDMDSGLFSTEYRASERMAQLLTQVSGRAGRAESPGRVLLQTHHPEHPLLHTLINDGYDAFSELLLKQRQEAGLPPFSYHALLRAEATVTQNLEHFLNEAKQQLKLVSNNLSVYGPILSVLPRKAGKHRMQLLIEAVNRAELSAGLSTWIQKLEQFKSAKKVRWNIDIDPQDMI